MSPIPSWLAKSKGNKAKGEVLLEYLARAEPSMRHVHRTIEDLRRYIARSESRAELEEVDALLAVALEELKRKLSAAPKPQPGSSQRN